MKTSNTFRGSALSWALFFAAALYLGALSATAYEDGMNLLTFMGAFAETLEYPFAICWREHTPRFLFGSVLLGCIGKLLYCATRESRRPGVEHGSAKWGDVRALDKKYRDKRPENNVILTQHLSMSLNGGRHRRNLLQIIVGGSGSGKTRFIVKPNVMLANTSYICTDPKGELLRSLGPLLLQKGYVLRVFDLVDPAHSDYYNPFAYLRSDSDVLKLITNFIKNTTPKNASQSDPFWEKSEIALDSALMLYLWHEAPVEEQTLEMVLTMIEYGGAREEADDYKSPLDLLFEALEEEQPDHIALRQYKIFKQAPGVVCFKRLLNQSVRKSLKTYNLQQRKERKL